MRVTAPYKEYLLNFSLPSRVSMIMGALALTLAACGDDPTTCPVPGEQQACVCPAGAIGTQSCQPDGDFSVCVCNTMPDAGAIDAGAMDAGAMDAGTDAGPQMTACDPNPCMNGGSCSEAGGSYSCMCPAGFLGDECQTVDVCAASPCGDNGTCAASGGSFMCTCDEGYSGELCDFFEEQTYGQMRNPSSDLCLDSFGRIGAAQMNTCHGERGNQEFIFNTRTGELRNPASGLCLDSFGRLGSAQMNTCTGAGGNQRWDVDRRGVYANPASGLCLDSFGRTGMAMVNGCNGIGGNQEFVGSP
ncbi:MAG: ricin-type beta-trefoil lectin domain protein [Polyangiales bacterium]